MYSYPHYPLTQKTTPFQEQQNPMDHKFLKFNDETPLYKNSYNHNKVFSLECLSLPAKNDRFIG